jgi:long-chain acyl-CoA synthetase
MISDLLNDVVRQQPGQLALVDGAERITFGELSERVRAARDWLRETLDPQPGDAIAVSLDNSWQFVASFFAVAELGCVLAPCNPQWRAAELRAHATRLTFRGAIIEPRFRGEWDQVLDAIPANRVLTADAIPSSASAFSSLPPPTVEASEETPAFFLSTSGSTGTPRLVPRSHRNLRATAENVGSTLEIVPGRRFLSVVPFFSSNGFHNGMLMPLLRGATLVMMRQFTPAGCAELGNRERVDTLFGSPFVYGYLVDSISDPASLASLQYCYSGGARLPSNVADRWRQRFGVPIRQSYGMSETGLITAERTAEARESSVGACIGQLVRNVEAIILGPGGESLGLDEIGELAVRSGSLMSGYFGEPELNRSRFLNGFFRTGDLGCLDSTGRIHLTGRMGRGINIAGTKIDPVEIERVVEMLPNVASCHVDAVSNGRGGEVVRARVVPLEGRPVTRRDVIEQCRQQLAEYKLPRVIEFLETSPANLAGKILRDRPPESGPAASS